MTSAQNLPTTPISTWQNPFKRQINQDNSVYLISVKASWWSESTHFTPCTGRTATTDREISITQQWRSKDLGTQWKTLPVIVTLYPNDNFWMGYRGFIPSSFLSSLQCCDPKKTHFYPLCSKFNIVSGGRGKVDCFIYITGKAPTLLTSTVV